MTEKTKFGSFDDIMQMLKDAEKMCTKKAPEEKTALDVANELMDIFKRRKI